MSEMRSTIDTQIGPTMLGHTFDPYLGYISPSSRTICSPCDVAQTYYVSDPNPVWIVPCYSAGSVDGNVATAADAGTVSIWGHSGRPNSVRFDAVEFLDQHPQWAWQEGYLASRPSQPWTYFDGNDEIETEE
jgi:hypothetical protein